MKTILTLQYLRYLQHRDIYKEIYFFYIASQYTLHDAHAFCWKALEQISGLALA